MESCPLCAGTPRAFLSDGGRDYLRCGTCSLTFLPPAQHPDAAAERERYSKHNNSSSDPDYRRFLDRLLQPLCARLEPGAEGLDFGCGPGPTAAVMMRERGFPTTDYDPFFCSDGAALAKRYDYVVCTEVFEHLRRPAEELARLDRLLKPGGVLGVMTGVLEDDSAFAGWWYRRDLTHIAFYRPETLGWIAGRFGWTLSRPSRDAALFLKA
ncbi:MAG TPA: class I SAM-dependent methyltransferase [Elusimicrobiota bacterium]|nr:class I SAM-dependent methyltransferase [Elusimicrobiota bacterium]